MKTSLKLVTFAIATMFLLCIDGSAQTETSSVTKAILTGVVTEGGSIYLRYRTPMEELVISEVTEGTKILLEDVEISAEQLKTLVESDEFSAWIWLSGRQATKVMLAKNVYQIRIKAIDPALKRLCSVDGRWYYVEHDVAIHRLVAGELVNVHLSFDGTLAKIVPAEPSIAKDKM